MSSDYPECEQFSGRKRQICRGEAGKALADQWRLKRWGLPPWISADSATDQPAAKKPKLSKSARRRNRVGDHFAAIVESLGFITDESDDCSCRSLRKRMNKLKPSGCQEKFDELVAELRTNSIRYTLREKFAAATKAVSTGLVFRGFINPIDPMPGLLREAIRRAEAKTPVERE